MATERLSPTHFSIIVGLLDTTFNNTVFIFNTISADLTFNGRGYPTEFFIVNVVPLSLQFLLVFIREIRKYGIIHFFNFDKLIFAERGTGIAVYTTASFTFVEIAYKLRFNNFVTYQLIFY